MDDRFPLERAPQIRLREERLDVRMTRDVADVATVGTEAVERIEAFRIAYVYEKCDVRTLDMAREAARRADPIVEPQRLTVRVSREKIVACIRTIVTEEIAVGRRSQTETLRVNAQVRRETLDVR